MGFISVNILEGYVARFAIVGSFLYFYVWFFLDVGRCDGRRRLFRFRVWFVDGMDQPGVSDHVASVRRSVSATVATVDLLSRHCWARRGGLTAFFFKHAGDEALLLKLRFRLVNYGVRNFCFVC